MKASTIDASVNLPKNKVVSHLTPQDNRDGNNGIAAGLNLCRSPSYKLTRTLCEDCQTI
jgi:hypothetical protein